MTDKREESAKTSRFITVFGAANMDIGGKPYGELTKKDSNPGQIRSAPGGVGRNIAHNLSLLGNRVKFISAFGDDIYARQICEGLWNAGVDTNDCFMSRKDPTSFYLYITDHAGNMELAINDMDIYGHLTPAFIREKSGVLSNSSFVVVDANLPEDTIEAICREFKCPVIAECVSCAKAIKLRRVLPLIHTITGNCLEAEALTGRKIDPEDPESLKAAADKLILEGAEKVVITLSARGAYFADKDTSMILSPVPARMVNSNGAGDALVSGLITGYAWGMTFEDSMILGMAAASITLETEKTNNPALSLEAALKRADL